MSYASIINSPENQGRYSNGGYDGSNSYISSNFVPVRNAIKSVVRTNDVVVEQYEWVVAKQEWVLTREIVHDGGVSIRTFDVNHNEVSTSKGLSKGTVVNFTSDILATAVYFVIIFGIDNHQVVNANIHPMPPQDPPENPDVWRLYYCLQNAINIDYEYSEWIIGDSPHSHHEDAEIFEPDYPTDSMPDAMWRVDQSHNNNRPYNELMRGIPISKGAFQGVASLAAVRVPITVKAIGSAAFAGTALQRVKIAADCAYEETSFPAGCIIEHYDDDRYEQLRDCEGRAILDCDARRIYVRKVENTNV